MKRIYADGNGEFNRKEYKDRRDWKCKSRADGKGKGLTADYADDADGKQLNPIPNYQLVSNPRKSVKPAVQFPNSQTHKFIPR